MLILRRSTERGHFDHGWLQTFYSFSFGEFRDPQFNHFHDLRVINEDHVAAQQGFGTHGHRDMEIITYVISGSLEHKDSLGNGSVIRPGDVQRMSAGTGVEHSEFNGSAAEAVHLLQIWIFPREKDLTPSYEQKTFAAELKQNRLCLIVSPDGAEGSVSHNSDNKIYASLLDPGQERLLALVGQSGWVQVVRGDLVVNGVEMKAGDGLGIEREENLRVRATSSAEFLVFSLI